MEDPNAPAKKSDIELLRGDVELLRDYVEQLRSETNHHYNDLVERIADGQTSLLKAFYGYAEGNNKRVADLENDQPRSVAASPR